MTALANQKAVNYTWRTYVPAKTELDCGTLLLFIHLNVAPAVKESENLMHGINVGGH